jgi:uncharacterized protein YkwD
MKNLLTTIIKTILISLTVTLGTFLIAGVYVSGLQQGYMTGQSDTYRFLQTLPTAEPIEQTPTVTSSPQSPAPQPRPVSRSVTWGGPDLWAAVNTRRQELGVNQLSTASELCTIASIRLNQLLELGKLDGHQGFSDLPESRPDLKWIFEKYGQVAEFLATGGLTAEETVALWENTLGHKKLLTGGEYVWGCTYAQNSFAVAITAF